MQTKFIFDSTIAGTVLVEVQDKQDAIVRRTITVEDFVKMVEQANLESGVALGKKELVFNPPEGCRKANRIRGLYMGTRRDSGYLKAVFFVPSCIDILNYLGNKYLIPYPSTIFYFESKGGKVIDTKVYATKVQKESDLNSDTLLYHFPFGNVYDNGKCCWGSVKLSAISDIEDFRSTIAEFFGSELNNDLYRVGTNIPAKIEFTSQKGLYDFLKDKKCFPEELLIPYKDKTLSCLEDEILN